MSAARADGAPATPSASEATVVGARATRPFVDRWLVVDINGTAMTMPARLVQLSSGELLARAEDLGRWRLRVPAAPRLSVRKEDYFALEDVDGVSYEIDERTQALHVRAAAGAFLPTVVHARALRAAPPDPASAGAFLNYDLQYQEQAGAHRTDGLFEVGAFNRRGFLTSTFIGRDLAGGRPFVRLDTAWTHDSPAELRSVRLGDSIGRPGSWGRSVRFGGVQWGTDFSTRPDFVAFPLPGVGGEAVVPSTVDLYVDNALRFSRQVPPGPFTIPDVPVITGTGQIRLVVRDALGRDRVFVEPYQASAGLLQPGLHDYTYEAGFVRRDFGIVSNDYGRFFAAATHRVGLSERLTTELRGEFERGRQTAGVAATYLLPAIGVLDAGVAVSRADGGSGRLLALGIERQGRPFSFGFETRLASEDFVQLGLAPGQHAPRRTSLARLSYATGGLGAFSLSRVSQAAHGEPAMDFVSAGYSAALPGNYYLSVFALQSLGGERDRSIGIYLTRALGTRTTASASWNRQPHDQAAGFEVQQNLPPGAGLGYRLAASGGERPREDAALFLRGEAGTYGVELARAGGIEAHRLSANGGAVWLGGGVHLARRLDDSFAVVKVGDYPNVPVYVDNQLVARTDAGGEALVPSLRPYQENSISIDQGALPLDARIATLRMPLSLPRRSGRVVSFPVQAVRGALLKVVLEDGTPLPAGAVLRRKDGDEAFPVALRGEVYVTGLADENELEASWKGRRCRIEVTLPRAAGLLPVLGPFLCKGVLP